MTDHSGASDTVEGATKGIAFNERGLQICREIVEREYRKNPDGLVAAFNALGFPTDLVSAEGATKEEHEEERVNSPQPQTGQMVLLSEMPSQIQGESSVSKGATKEPDICRICGLNEDQHKLARQKCEVQHGFCSTNAEQVEGATKEETAVTADVNTTTSTSRGVQDHASAAQVVGVGDFWPQWRNGAGAEEILTDPGFTRSSMWLFAEAWAAERTKALEQELTKLKADPALGEHVRFTVEGFAEFLGRIEKAEAERDKYRWIRVEEKLPEPFDACGYSRLVLVTYSNKVTTGLYDRVMKRWRNAQYIEATVTHWMPPPEPPGEALAPPSTSPLSNACEFGNHEACVLSGCKCGCHRIVAPPSTTEESK